ncbi:MAG: hypothetical protein H0U74_19295 [Bradymonadaceae bacterium]|nr:hypothetical protein [Lujinxingiaceae bacterium]
MSWTGVTGASKYRIYRRELPDGVVTQAAEVSSAPTGAPAESYQVGVVVDGVAIWGASTGLDLFYEDDDTALEATLTPGTITASLKKFNDRVDLATCQHGSNLLSLKSHLPFVQGVHLALEQ